MMRRSPKVETPEEKLDRVLELVRRVAVAVTASVIISIFSSVAVVINVDNNDETIDKTSVNAENVSDYVDDLKEPTPEEVERNKAVTEAVQQVPQIKAILCSDDAFPQAEGCKP